LSRNPAFADRWDGTFLLHKFLAASQNPNDPDQGLPGADLLWPGEFVFGYPRKSKTTKKTRRVRSQKAGCHG